VILYSAFGGIKAVTATDVLQFLVLIVAIPMIFNVGINLSGGISETIDKIPPHLLALPDTPQAIIKYFFIFLGFAIPFLDPPTMQRLLMAKDLKQIKGMLRVGAIIEVPFYLAIGAIGLIAASMYPNLEPNVAFPHLVNTILPVGLKGFAVIGLFSVVMSTADSYLNAAGISLIHDTIKPLFNLKLNDRSELLLTQITTLVLGTIAAVIALSFKSIMSIILFSLNFWGPIVVVPLYAILLGYRVTAQCFHAGALSGIIGFFLWEFLVEPHLQIESLIPSMAANALGFYLAHRLRKTARLRELGAY
jgi:SSS family solute:Na+ symporter